MELGNVRSVDRTAFYAPTALGRTRRVTPEGYLVCTDVRIARTGEMLYHERDFASQSKDGAPPLKGDQHGFIRVKRAPQDVFDPESLASFNGKPLTMEHPNAFVTPQTDGQLRIGTIMNVRQGEGIDDDHVVADIMITDAMAISYVNKKLPQLSAGYDCSYAQDQPGVAQQKRIIGNHVALVNVGRAGPRVSINDHASTETYSMNFSQWLKALLTQHNVPTADADSITAAMLAEDKSSQTVDAATSEILSLLKSIDSRVTAIETKDAKAKEEAEAALAQATTDAATKAKEEADAAAAAEAKAVQSVDAVNAAETAGEVLLQNGDGVLSLSATKIYGEADPYVEITARAAILVPEVAIPTKDSLKGSKGAELAKLMRAVLTTRATTDAETVGNFTLGRKVEDLSGYDLLGAFNGAASLAKTIANRDSMQFKPATGKGSKVVTGADLNERNKGFWNKDKVAAK